MSRPSSPRTRLFGASLLTLTLALASARVLAASDGPTLDTGTVTRVAAAPAGNASGEAAAAKAAPANGESALALTVPPMNPFASPLADKPLMSFEAPAPEDARILMCTPPAPSLIDFAECCQKAGKTYVGKYEFCYCVPSKFVKVCKKGPGSEANPSLIEAQWCQTTTTHPYWPNRSLSCVQ